MATAARSALKLFRKAIRRLERSLGEIPSGNRQISRCLALGFLVSGKGRRNIRQRVVEVREEGCSGGGDGLSNIHDLGCAAEDGFHQCAVSGSWGHIGQRLPNCLRGQPAIANCLGAIDLKHHGMPVLSTSEMVEEHQLVNVEKVCFVDE